MFSTGKKIRNKIGQFLRYSFGASSNFYNILDAARKPALTKIKTLTKLNEYILFLCKNAQNNYYTFPLFQIINKTKHLLIKF